MSTNNLQEALTELDEAGQIGLDGFNQMTWYRTEGTDRVSSGIMDVRGQTCPLCGKGWEITTKSWADQTYHSSRGMLLHKSCFLRYLTFREYMTWHGAIVDAKMRFEKPIEIPNEYGHAWNTPWYTIRLTDHNATMKVGARKRVSHIGIIMDKPRQEVIERMDELFADQDVTKGCIYRDDDGEIRSTWKDIRDDAIGYYVHSYTGESDKEYIKRMAMALSGTDKLVYVKRKS